MLALVHLEEIAVSFSNHLPRRLANASEKSGTLKAVFTNRGFIAHRFGVGGRHVAKSHQVS